MPPPLAPLRTECPPGACICEREALLQGGGAQDARILRLTREEEARLLARLARIDSLADLRHMQRRLHEQLGLRLVVESAAQEVRSLRGILVALEPQPGLCRKTRQSVPAAIRSALQARPEIAWALLDEGGLFAHS
ncbi:hypothetical protein C6568_15450 [Melaminivora suipulveris]|uniref:Ribosomal protein S3AE n=1 Tax=Melaminivora suipulveris TaxID=2109913 RepID=A0A2R3QFE8_9BURK|nr:hypothetical protein [Melaminivora suipulveris]AVO50482.1 hypothetical protein C6568_15450 [Melaminivora suipulveris]